MHNVISNRNSNIILGFFLLIFFSSCGQSKKVKVHKPIVPTESNTNIIEKPQITYNKEEWNEVLDTEGIQLDIRYASDDNFTKKKIYRCAKCFLRPEVAQKINQIHADLKKRYGYGLKMFDCYRPRPYQQKLWDIVPNAMYVTPPKKGSMHNRGLAVDLTITDEYGEALDMGTTYDYFGKEAHRTYVHPDPIVRKNRELLKVLMETYGFTGIRTEWWHYSLKTVSYDFSDWEWDCE